MRYDTLYCTFASYNAITYNEDEFFTCAFFTLVYLGGVSNRKPCLHGAAAEA